MTFTPGERRTYALTLPMQLTPGEYTAVLTLRSQPPLYAQTTVKVGPGPFVTDLVLREPARAGQPIGLAVAFRNIWCSAVTADLRLCGQSLLIRDAEGNTVYDNKPEKEVCRTDLRPTTVPSGGLRVTPWPVPPLKVGWYTAILWGGAVKRFEVKP
ncbi:hypothetical protein [Deinococcus aquaedulcis]|uniref:hypothetical protein n=1 Tax=Deinococcus aquaedulcis TaxID=2840455 RepID=UPI001C8284AB|nr:hypothetical protein [Deinococcus aquaedulcis]